MNLENWSNIYFIYINYKTRLYTRISLLYVLNKITFLFNFTLPRTQQEPSVRILCSTLSDEFSKRCVCGGTEEIKILNI